MPRLGLPFRRDAITRLGVEHIEDGIIPLRMNKKALYPRIVALGAARVSLQPLHSSPMQPGAVTNMNQMT